MLIVQGVFRIDPELRDAYLEERIETMRISRGEQGCLEYTVAADPVEPDRAVLAERWESMDDLNEYTRALNRRRRAAAEAGEAPGVVPLSTDIAIYHIESVQQMT
jgi:quinol monooxygenase YgiN